jgi:hypothetical protein
MKKRPLSTLSYTMLLYLLMGQLSFSACTNKETNISIKQKNTSISFNLKSAKETGISFNNQVEEKYETFFDKYAYIYSGGGVAVGDINNDDLQDVYFTGNEVEDKLYLNKGNFKFEDITATAILSGQEGWHNGVTIIDINEDGLNDIYVCRGGWQDSPTERRNLLYINNGNETFTEKATEYGLADEGYSMQALFIDIDNDNDLDLYLTNRPDEFYLPLSLMEKRAQSGPDCCSDRLYRNDFGKFIDISREAGIINYGYSLGLNAADFNNDDLIDIYVSNDFATADHMYINQGDGTFKDEIQKALNHTTLFSMGTDIADIDNDGLEDIIIMEMRPEDYVRSKVSMPPMNIQGFHAIVDAGMHKQYMHNMLQLNRGNGIFSEIGQMAGIAKTDWSWAGLLGDFDHDGNRDLFVTNGMRRDLFDGDARRRLTEYVNQNREAFQDTTVLFGVGFSGIIDTYKPLKLNNYLFQGNANITFSDISQNANISMPSFSYGSALADFDNDGDLDIIVNNMEDPAFVLENTSINTNNWIKIKLEGPAKNKAGIGAKIWAYSGEQRYFFQQKIVRGYLSSSDANIFFGMGEKTKVDSLIIHWSNGKRSYLSNLPVNELVKVAYKDNLRPIANKQSKNQIFTEKNNYLIPPHKDTENEVFEYQNQVLLPHSFATSGPKMSSADVNADGVEDFYIGGSRSEAGALYLSSKGKWVKSDQKAFYLDRIFEDMGSVFIDYDRDGDQDLYVVSGGSEAARGEMVYQDRLYENQNGQFIKSKTLPPIRANGSQVLKHDFDKDGDSDLLVVGYIRPNSYPLGDASFFLENRNGNFVLARWYGEVLNDLGIIYDATMAQLDQDEEKELVLVGEWMPITILDWNGHQFENKTATFGLKNTRGWWTSIEAADVDNDGKEDLVVGNLGENYKFKVDNTHKFEVFADDFDKNGTYDVFLATSSKFGHKPVRGLECSSEQMPILSQKFETFASFANAEINEIIGPDINKAEHRKIDLFSSIILYNTGNNGFDLKKLPDECQLSVINGIIIADINEDGKKDLLTAGNRFHVEVETTPSDASIGALLINDGNRTWRTIKAVDSGIYLNGDVKDLLYIDGKLIASENDGAVRVLVKNDSM